MVVVEKTYHGVQRLVRRWSALVMIVIGFLMLFFVSSPKSVGTHTVGSTGVAYADSTNCESNCIDSCDMGSEGCGCGDASGSCT